MRVAVTGGRSYTDRRHLYRVLDALSPTEVAHGGADGADLLVGLWAGQRGRPCRVYGARWTSYLRGWAGHARNGLMLRDFSPDLLVVFTGDRGTRDCWTQAKDQGVRYLLACSEKAVRTLDEEDPKAALLALIE